MTKRIVCSDCGAEKPAVSFGWNKRTQARNAYCKTCGRGKRLARFRQPKIEGSILGR